MTKDFKLGAAVGVAATGATLTIVGLGVKIGGSIANKVKERKVKKAKSKNEENNTEIKDVEFKEAEKEIN